MSEGQFIGWQNFWDSLKKGANWFLIDLFRDDVWVEMNAHALSQWSSTLTPNRLWQTNLNIEAYE